MENAYVLKKDQSFEVKMSQATYIFSTPYTDTSFQIPKTHIDTFPAMKKEYAY